MTSTAKIINVDMRYESSRSRQTANAEAAYSELSAFEGVVSSPTTKDVTKIRFQTHFQSGVL